MLVLSRKIGETIVLPEHEVTIAVVGISRNKVRLGVTAPAQVPVHRKEVWQRIAEPQRSPAEVEENKVEKKTANGDGIAEHTIGDLVKNSSPEAESGRPWLGTVDMNQALARWITKRTGGRIRSLHVETTDGRVVIRGQTQSYYVRQLAQAAVSEALGPTGSEPQEAIDVDIEVVS